MEEQWQKDAREAKEKKELQKKFPFLGKKVRRKGRKKWEEGVVVIDKLDESNKDEQFIEYNSGDKEQLEGLPFQVWDDESSSWNENQ
jgi:hypothetical protein